MSATLFQNFYKEEQRKDILPFAVPHFNEGLTIFFEGDVIKRLVPACETEKVGVCSWKLVHKMRNIGRLEPHHLKLDYEVLSLTRNGREHKMLAMLNTWHPKSLAALKLLWAKMGLGEVKETKQPIYQHHFMAKTEIYRRFVTEFMIPAHYLIENDEELNAIMMLPSNYGALSRDADIKSVKSKLGIEFYPLCPFVLERCPSLWFDMHNIPVRYL